MESDSIHIKRPSLSMCTRKSCLKTPSPLPSPPSHSTLPPVQDIHISSGGSGSSTPKKSVSWHNCQDDPDRCFEEIFIADDWDRTPMEPAQPLSYKDILELKAIQRTLPRAQQLPDPYTGKKPNHFLSAVPIALLPLLPDSTCPSGAATPNPTPEPSPPNLSPAESKHTSPCASPPRSPSTRPSNLSPCTSSASAPSASYSHSPRVPSPLCPTLPPLALSSPTTPTPTTPTSSWLPHLQPPSKPPSPPKQRKFSFIPLLETPPPSSPPCGEPPQPQSLTNAINAAFATPLPPPLPHEEDEEETDPPTPALTNASLTSGCESDLLTDTEDEGLGLGLHFSPSPSPSPSPPHQDDNNKVCEWTPITFKRKPPPAPKKKKKNVMYINGEEIELDDSDSEDESDEDLPPHPPPSSKPTPRLPSRPVSCSPPLSSSGGGGGHGMVVGS